MANIVTDSNFSRKIAENIMRYLTALDPIINERVKFNIEEIGYVQTVKVSYDINFINTLLYCSFEAGASYEKRIQSERVK